MVTAAAMSRRIRRRRALLEDRTRGTLPATSPTPVQFAVECPVSNAVTCSDLPDQRPAFGTKRSTGLSYRVPLALIVVLLAILGALLHPLVWALGFFSFMSPLIPVLATIRVTISDLLGWGVLALLAIMALYIGRGRL